MGTLTHTPKKKLPLAKVSAGKTKIDIHLPKKNQKKTNNKTSYIDSNVIQNNTKQSSYVGGEKICGKKQHETLKILPTLTGTQKITNTLSKGSNDETNIIVHQQNNPKHSTHTKHSKIDSIVIHNEDTPSSSVGYIKKSVTTGNVTHENINTSNDKQKNTKRIGSRTCCRINN